MGWHADGRINNAGSNAYSYGPLANATDADLINIVETNVLGVMLCCREVRRKHRDTRDIPHTCSEIDRLLRMHAHCLSVCRLSNS